MTCRAGFVQLREFLDEGGLGKLTVIAVNWDEGRYGNPSDRRLNRMVKGFHPAIKAVSMNDAVMKHFSPVTYVPASFIFDKSGKKIFGDGTRMYLDKQRVAEFAEKLQ